MILHVEVWIIMVNDDDNGIMMMITWCHSMITMPDEYINHGMNGVKV